MASTLRWWVVIKVFDLLIAVGLERAAEWWSTRTGLRKALWQYLARS